MSSLSQSPRFFLRRWIFRLLLIFFILILNISLRAQPSLKNPWTGGLNAAQFCQIDLNLDGNPDLVAFDRHGNRILPFLSMDATPGNTDYSYSPYYASYFPDLHDWVRMIDYDHDGKMDIFTYGLGGTRVFRNVSDTILKFRKVTDMLTSYYYSGYVGILMTNVDYPAFSDIDNDGDIDILTFFGLGSYVEFHKNLSIEKYGNSDSLDFKLTDQCWGDFQEGIESNVITLDISCPYKFNPLPGSGCYDHTARHTGSTLLATDLNGDSLCDIIIGDYDYPQLITIINGGTPDRAHMISKDTIFPFSPQARLFSFPACSFLDIDHDGLKDIVVSPFDPSLISSVNFRSCLFYRNEGTALAPHFVLKTDRFLQNEMIDAGSGACPVFADLNKDGLTDLVIGNYGFYDSSYYQNGMLKSVYHSQLSYYQNTGTINNPVFTLMNNDLAGLSSLHLTGLAPAVGDVDGDGSPDLITGCNNGTLIFSKNTGSNTPSFENPVLNFQNIDPGEFSTPQLFDFDGDGLNDLIIGEKKGNLNYYRNSGTATNPIFHLITDSLGKINVTNYNLSYDGYSTPCFFRKNGEKFLICGSEEGKLYFFTGIGNDPGIQFHPSDTLYKIVNGPESGFSAGIRTAASITTFGSNNFMDLVIGNYSGGLNYFSESSLPTVITGITEHPDEVEHDFTVFPNPALNRVQIKSNSSDPFSFKVSNSLGMMVLDGVSTPGNTSFSVKGFPPGLYLIHVFKSSGINAIPLVFRIIVL